MLFLADSRIAVSGSYQHQGSDQTVRFWDIATGQEVMSFTGGKGGVHSLALSHAGESVAAGGGGTVQGKTWIYDHDIHLLDSQTGRAKARLEGQGFFVNDLAFSVDDRYLIAGSFQKENSPGLRLYSIEDGVSVPRFGLDTGSVSCLAVSPDGILVVGGTTACEGEPCLRLWNVVTGEQVSDFSGYRGMMHDITFSTDGRFVLTVGNELTMWDLETLSKVRQVPEYAHCVSFSSDGRNFAVGSGDYDEPGAPYKDCVVRLYEFDTFNCTEELEGHPAPISTVAFPPDGRHILSGDVQGNLLLWEL